MSTQQKPVVQEEDSVRNRYLNPTNDVAFKKLFGTEEHKPLLLSFLNAVLRLKEENFIEDLEFLPQEEAPMIDGGRRVIFDVKCRDRQGNEMIIEMQNRNIPEFVKRTQYYVSHCYVSQIGGGTAYFELKPVVLIAISNFNLFEDDDDPISYHKTLNVKTHVNHLKDLEYVFIELPKFTKTAEDLTSIEDQWLYFLKHASKLDSPPRSVVSEEIIEAFNSLEQFKWSPESYDAYVRFSIGQTDDYLIIKKEREEGREEGKREIARKMLLQNIPDESITELTGLSLVEIKALKKS